MAVVNDAAVELTISFPPITVSAAEVDALRRGQVVELGARLCECELSVEVGGRRMASGYLVVLVEDRPGLMISQVLK